MYSIVSPAAVTKLGKAEDTVYSNTAVKINLPEDNSSGASSFTTYPEVASDSLLGIHRAQIQLEGGGEMGEESIFFLLKCKEF